MGLFERVSQFVSSRTDNIVLGERDWSFREVIDENDADDTGLEGGGAGDGNQDKIKQRWKRMGRYYYTLKNQWFRRRGDLGCCIGISIIVLYILFTTFFGILYTNGNTIDLTKLGRLLHGSHDAGEEGESDAKTMADMLRFAEYTDPETLPPLYNTKCRKVTDQEIIKGRTYQGTSLPFLLQVLCQVIHQDAGCTGSSRGIVPRAVNASLLMQEFFKTTGRDPGMMQYFDTKSPTITREIEEFSDLHFFGVGSGTHEQHYMLEDLCLITYKDDKGICYHYFNPDLKSLPEKNMPMISNDKGSGSEEPKGADGGFFSTAFNDIAGGMENILGNAGQSKEEKDLHVMLTVRSRIFSFLGAHIVKIFVPVIFQYQPIVEGDFGFAMKLDSMSITDKDEQEESIAETILEYEEALNGKLLSPEKDAMWMRSSPSAATFGISPGPRAYQLAMMSQVLEGQYLSPEFFETPEQQLEEVNQ